MSSLISVILLSSLCCVSMHMFRSSYFKISSQENLDEETDFTITTQVHDELSCASLCSSTVLCHYALFDKDSKQCSFARESGKLNQQDGEEHEPQKILLEKVGNVQWNKRTIVRLCRLVKLFTCFVWIIIVSFTSNGLG